MVRIFEGESDTNQTDMRKSWQSSYIEGNNRQLLQDDARLFMHQSVSTPCLSALASAEGAYIEDVQGKKYLDWHGNNVHHIGYRHPKLIEALQEQLHAGLTFCPRRYTNQTSIMLAEKLTSLTPPSLNKVLFTTGGSDAVEIALKIARAATGRHKFLSFWDSFHGAGFAASSIGGEALFRSHRAAGPLLSGTEHVAPPNCYRCAYGHNEPFHGPDKKCNLACAHYLAYVLEKEEDVAAVIAEPVRALGMTVPEGYWEIVRAACNKTGTLLIFDDIPNGLGKTGAMFSHQHYHVTPDILVLGKALGGGIVPIAAVIANADQYQLSDYAIGHYTHEKNPFTARAALTTIQIIEQERLVENAENLGDYALKKLNVMQQKHDSIGKVDGKGLSLSIELVKHSDTKEKNSLLAEKVMYEALSKGLSFKTSMGNILTLTPSLISTKQQIDEGLTIIDQALQNR